LSEAGATLKGVSDDRLAVVYELAREAVEQQAHSVDEIRNRAAIVLGAAGVVTGFLGRDELWHGIGPFGTFAFVFFSGTAFWCIAVLLPFWGKWRFTFNAKSLLPYFLHPSASRDSSELLTYLIDQSDAHRVANDQLLHKLYSRFTLACVAFSVEVALWLLAFLLD
jgi:hypothetical protein